MFLFPYIFIQIHCTLPQTQLVSYYSLTYKLWVIASGHDMFSIQNSLYDKHSATVQLIFFKKARESSWDDAGSSGTCCQASGFELDPPESAW